MLPAVEQQERRDEMQDGRVILLKKCIENLPADVGGIGKEKRGAEKGV